MVKVIETESRTVVTRGRGRRNGELMFHGTEFPLGIKRKVLEMDSDGCTTL